MWFQLQAVAAVQSSTRVTTSTTATTASGTDGVEPLEPPLKKWKCLAAKQRAAAAAAGRPTVVPSTPQSEMNKYLIELRTSTPVSDALTFWQERRGSYPQLAPLAEDLVSAPASQAFVERIFSVCGMLTTGRRNRMEKSLEMRVFLKLNAHLIN